MSAFSKQYYEKAIVKRALLYRIVFNNDFRCTIF